MTIKETLDNWLRLCNKSGDRNITHLVNFYETCGQENIKIWD